MHLRYSSQGLYLSRNVGAAVRFVCSTLPMFPAGSAVLKMRRIYSLSRDLTSAGVKRKNRRKAGKGDEEKSEGKREKGRGMEKVEEARAKSRVRSKVTVTSETFHDPCEMPVRPSISSVPILLRVLLDSQRSPDPLEILENSMERATRRTRARECANAAESREKG